MTPEQAMRTFMEDLERLTTGLFIFYIFLAALTFAGFCFWIWMMVDCIKRKRDNPLIGWMLLLVFLSVPGAIVYFFAGRNQRSSVPLHAGSSDGASETITKVEPMPGGLTVHPVRE